VPRVIGRTQQIYNEIRNTNTQSDIKDIDDKIIKIKEIGIKYY
jgi:hypothetical protein